MKQLIVVFLLIFLFSMTFISSVSPTSSSIFGFDLDVGNSTLIAPGFWGFFSGMYPRANVFPGGNENSGGVPRGRASGSIVTVLDYLPSQSTVWPTGTTSGVGILLASARSSQSYDGPPSFSSQGGDNGSSGGESAPDQSTPSSDGSLNAPSDSDPDDTFSPDSNFPPSFSPQGEGGGESVPEQFVSSQGGPPSTFTEPDDFLSSVTSPSDSDNPLDNIEQLSNPLSFGETPPIPEPSSFLLVSFGLLGASLFKKKKGK